MPAWRHVQLEDADESNDRQGDDAQQDWQVDTRRNVRQVIVVGQASAVINDPVWKLSVMEC